MIFPNNLRKIRESQVDKNLRSGNKVAELLGITPQYYYSLETGKDGKRLNSELLTKLTKVFNVSADEILGSGAESGLGSIEIFAKKKSGEYTNFTVHNRLSNREKQFLILARHTENIPDEDMERLSNTLKDTIDLYLSRINKNQG